MDKRQLNVLIEYLKTLTSRQPLSDDEFMALSFPPTSNIAGKFVVEDLDSTIVPKASYVGNRVCAGCHVKQYKTWLGTRHARSFVVLGTQMAKAIGKEHGINTSSPQRSVQCLQCHAPFADIPAEYRARDFFIEEGVQCERCHGPGEYYANAEVMKDKQKAISLGLHFVTSQDCQQCHRPKPSHALAGKGPFEFEKFWPRVSH